MRTPSCMPSSSLIFSALVCAILDCSWNMYLIPEAVKKSAITSTKVSHVISKININVTSLKYIRGEVKKKCHINNKGCRMTDLD